MVDWLPICVRPGSPLIRKARAIMTDLQNPAIPAINADRLWARHMEMAQIGVVEKTGNCRLALTPEDVAARILHRDDAVGIFAKN